MYKTHFLSKTTNFLVIINIYFFIRLKSLFKYATVLLMFYEIMESVKNSSYLLYSYSCLKTIPHLYQRSLFLRRVFLFL